MLVCICVEFAEICCVSGCVSMLVVKLMLLNVVCFFESRCVWVDCLCSGCVGCCAFCLLCDA